MRLAPRPRSSRSAALPRLLAGLALLLATGAPAVAAAWPTAPTRPALAEPAPAATTADASVSAPTTAPAEPAPAAAPAETTAAEPHAEPAPGKPVPTRSDDTGDAEPAKPVHRPHPGESKDVVKEELEEEAFAEVNFHGAMEAYYAWNFNDPSNNITNWRWYDHRHNLVGLQGLWFVPDYKIGPVSGHFQLQLGVLAELFWYSERSLEEDLLWRLLQEATMEWKTGLGGLSIEGGIFNVPFGPEWNLAFRNWNWSTSNLFALMPYQVTGFRANYDFGRGFIARLGIYNGWDRIVRDNNKSKAMMASLEWTDPNDEETYVFFNYMMGNERDLGDDRGRAPRHTFDLYAQWHVARPLFIRGWTFSGFEKRQAAVDGWLGLAGFVRVEPLEWFAVTGRGDYVYTKSSTENLFHTDVLADPNTSTALGSGTLTLDFRPHDNVLFRLEGRYDTANFPLFYRGQVPLADPADPQSYVTTAGSQATVLAGMTTFF